MSRADHRIDTELTRAEEAYFGITGSLNGYNAQFGQDFAPIVSWLGLSRDTR